MNKNFHYLFIFILYIMTSAVFAQRNYSDSDITKVILLGTGNPNPDPEHHGCSIAVVVHQTPYIVDFGPGIIRQAAALSPSWGGNIEAMEIRNIKRAFLSHLHSDHTTGYPDLILSPWIDGRNEPLEVYGPEGIKEMTAHILKAYQEDIKYRLYGLQPVNNQGWRVHAHEITEGPIYEDENVKVEAFHVKHGSWPNAFGFRFHTPDKIIVISGDTRPCENIVKYGQGADILIHEVYYQDALKKRSPFWQRYHASSHTSTDELGELANQIKPQLLILYHILFWGASEEDLLSEIEKKYHGKVIVGRDLDIF